MPGLLILLFCAYAEVVELVDTLDLGSSAARCEGSNPFFGTMNIIKVLQRFLRFLCKALFVWGDNRGDMEGIFGDQIH